jgi:hypothetical protein
MPMINGEFRRHNGFETPLDRLQILSYLLFAFMISSFYALLVPLTVEPSVRIALIVLYSALLSCLIYGAFTSSKIDPVDKTVNEQLQQTPREIGPGELLYCCFCKCKVHKRSKHCRVCNKCIGNFDHHCKWLNNCIGGENYRIFFFTISSASLLTGLQLAWNAVVLKRYLDDANLRLGVPHLSQQGSDAVLAWLCIALVVSTGVFTLLVHLVIFHIFLNHQGISTYDYILKQRAKKAAKKEVCSTPRPFPLLDTRWAREGPTATKYVAVSLDCRLPPRLPRPLNEMQCHRRLRCARRIAPAAAWGPNCRRRGSMLLKGGVGKLSQFVESLPAATRVKRGAVSTAFKGFQPLPILPTTMVWRMQGCPQSPLSLRWEMLPLLSVRVRRLRSRPRSHRAGMSYQE